MAQASVDVTVETVRDYLVSRGGVVKNVDLVRHFRSFLQQDDPEKKAQARTLFKDYVNDIASIKLENNEKYLILKPHLQQEVGIGSPKQPQPFSPFELADSNDGGVLSPMSFNQSYPPKQSRAAQQHIPAGKPPLAIQQPPEPHPPQQRSQSPPSQLQAQPFPILAVSPPSSSSLKQPPSRSQQSPPAQQTSAPPPHPAPFVGSVDSKKLSASTDSLERSGGLTASVTRRIKSPMLGSAARRSGSFNYAEYRHSVSGHPSVPNSGRLSPRSAAKGRFVIPAGPGLEERKSMFESHARRINLTPQQSKKARHSVQSSIKQSSSRDSNLAVVGTEGANNEWDDTSSINTSGSAVEYEGLDPTEHEWINASTDADVDTIHRLLMVDSTLVNRKDFFMGYTALHWAALHGRVDMVTGLMINGGLLDIKSNGGYTPLHLAAQRGHDNVIYTLVREHGARADIRENSGRLAIDMLKPTASEGSRALLETGLKDYGLRRKPVAEARRSVTSKKGSGGAPLAAAKMWSSMGDIIEGDDETDERKRNKRSTSILRRFSMRRDKKKTYLSEIYESEDNPSPSLDRKKNRQKAQSELLSYAV